MLVRLAYGREGLLVEFPEAQTTIIEPVYVPALPDQFGALKVAMRHPIGTSTLRQFVNPGQRIAISVCDITRPMPSSTVLPVLLGELEHVPDDNITILVATGTHRSCTWMRLTYW